MAELYRLVKDGVFDAETGFSDDYQEVGYTEDDVRRLAVWAAKHVPANLLAPFRALIDGGKPNG